MRHEHVAGMHASVELACELAVCAALRGGCLAGHAGTTPRYFDDEADVGDGRNLLDFFLAPDRMHVTSVINMKRLKALVHITFKTMIFMYICI